MVVFARYCALDPSEGSRFVPILWIVGAAGPEFVKERAIDLCRNRGSATCLSPNRSKSPTWSKISSRFGSPLGKTFLALSHHIKITSLRSSSRPASLFLFMWVFANSFIALFDPKNCCLVNSSEAMLILYVSSCKFDLPLSLSVVARAAFVSLSFAILSFERLKHRSRYGLREGAWKSTRLERVVSQ